MSMALTISPNSKGKGDCPMTSIIIPTFNSSKTLLATLESVELQEESIEIIIVDNLSKDSTVQIAETFAKSSKFSLKIFFNEKLNVGASRNIGVSHAQGEFILFLDSDDLMKEGGLSILLNDITNHDIVFGGWEDFEDTLNQLQYVTTYDSNLNDDPIDTFFRYKPVVSSSLIKKIIVASWNEELTVWEVTQFFIDILAKKAKVKFVRDVVTSIRQHSSQDRLSIKNKHFDPQKIIEFLDINKHKLKEANLLSQKAEVTIDEQIISNSYEVYKRNRWSRRLEQILSDTNLRLLKHKKRYKHFGVYHFVILFNGSRGLRYFHFVNKLLRRL